MVIKDWMALILAFVFGSIGIWMWCSEWYGFATLLLVPSLLLLILAMPDLGGDDVRSKNL